MQRLNSRILFLREDVEIIDRDFLQVLKHIGGTKTEKGQIRMPLSQIARISSLEKINTVLKRSIDAVEILMKNEDYTCYHDVINRLSEDVDKTGAKLHHFCLHSLLPPTPAKKKEVKASTPKDTSTSEHTHKQQKQQNDEDSTVYSTDEEDLILTNEDDIYYRLVSFKKRNLSLSMIKSKFFTRKLNAASDQCYGPKSESIIETDKKEEEKEELKHAWLSDSKSIEKHIHILFTFIEQLLLSLKRCTMDIETEICLHPKAERSKSTDTADKFLKLIDQMDREEHFSWQKANSTDSYFKKSLSFRERNTVKVKMQRDYSPNQMTTTHVESLLMQLPVRYKRTGGTGEIFV